MEVVSSLHEILAWVLVFVAAGAGAWATAAHWVEPLRVAPMWWAQHVMHTLVVVQVALGSVRVGFSDIDADGTHMFYGFLCFVAVGMIIGYRHLSQYKYLLYGLGGLFIMGLAIRAMLLNPIAST